MDQQQRSPLAADELDAAQAFLLPDREELSIINPTPMPPHDFLPDGGEPIKNPTDPPPLDSDMNPPSPSGSYGR